jgi:hypothetical protein
MVTKDFIAGKQKPPTTEVPAEEIAKAILQIIRGYEYKERSGSW